MAMERGGRASKLGGSYERLFAVRHALAVIAGHSAAIQWEALGDDEVGVDLWVTELDGTRTAYQAKRDNGSSGSWTVHDLHREGVLRAAKLQLERDPTVRFRFVSSCTVRHVRDLAEFSHRADDDPEAFVKHQVLVNLERTTAFHTLLAYWSFDPSSDRDRADAFRLLQRLGFALFDRPDSALADVMAAAASLLDSEPRLAVDAIGGILDDEIGNTLHADRLRALLSTRDVHLLNLERNPRLESAVSRLQQRFRVQAAEQLIADAPIDRPESDQLIQLLTRPVPPRIVFVTGDGGSGKSVVLHQAAQALARADIPHLPIRLDLKRPTSSPRRFGIDCLDLPASPATVLRTLAGTRHAVLVLDQLDALRMTSVHSASEWDACRELIDEALSQHDFSIVLACRTFDLENDPLIAGWRRTPSTRSASAATISVGDLPEDSVAQLLASIHVAYKDLPTRERELLRSPGTLAIWWHLATASSPVAPFSSRTTLLRQFMEQRRRQASLAAALPAAAIGDALEAIVRYMDRNGRLTVPDTVFPEHYEAVTAICSVGLMRVNDHVLQFAHQTYFDHLLAESVMRACLRDGDDPLHWIHKNQSLFRRDQIRQLLTLLRDDRDVHRSLLSRLFDDSTVRFHIKHLVLGLLGQEAAPRDYELQLVERLVSVTDLWENAFGAILFGKTSWFDALASSGQLARWLHSWTDDARLNVIMTFLRTVMPERGEAIDRLLDPYWDAGPDWVSRLDALATFDPADDSPALFQLRLERIRTGRWSLHDVFLTATAKSSPERVSPLLAAVYQSWLKQTEAGLSDDLTDPASWPLERIPLDESVLSAVRADCVSALGWLPTTLRRLHSLSRLARRHKRRSDDFTRSWRQQNAVDEAVKTTRRLFASVVAGLTTAHPDSVRDLLRTPRRCTRGIERPLIDGLIAGTDNHADNALTWLLRHRYRLELGDGHDEPRWDPAVRLIRRFAPHCSTSVYQALEAAILSYHHSSERSSLERQLERLMAGYAGPSGWGRGQLQLLSALPPARLSPAAAQRLAAWRSKFGDASTDMPSGRIGFGRVMSPLPSGPELHQLPDSAWLEIVRGDWPEEDSRLRVRAAGGFMESSVRHFSQDLSLAARHNPRRFASLALRMPRTASPTYFAGLLSAIGDTRPPDNVPDWQSASEGEIEAVVQHVGPCSHQEYVIAVCRLVRSRGGTAWTEAMRDRILSWASHPHPIVDDFTVRSNSGPDGSMEPDVAATACNCVRGVVSEALAKLCWDRPDWIPVMLPTIRSLLHDEHVAVRFEAAGLCLPLIHSDGALATDLLLAACAHQDDRVLLSHWVHRAIGYLRWTHLSELEPLLLRMARSRVDKVAQRGSSWVTICHLSQHTLTVVVEELANGSLAQRSGVVGALLDCYPKLEPAAGVRKALTTYFDDDAEEVRNLAAQVFYRKDALDQADAPELAQAFVQSSAFAENPEDLIRQLEDSTVDLKRFSNVILAATDRIAGDLATKTRDFTTRMAFVGDDLSKLLFRLYEQSYRVDAELNEACLDRWDLMLRHRVGMTERHLRQLDL